MLSAARGDLGGVSETGGSEIVQGFSMRASNQLKAAFDRDDGHGLLWLGALTLESAPSLECAYFRQFAMRYLAIFCAQPCVENDDSTALTTSVPSPDAALLSAWAEAAPPMVGAEYLDPSVLAALWQRLDTAMLSECKASGQDRQAFLKSLNPALNTVGRVHFNLAENRNDEESPFAFVATYTRGLSQQGRTEHLPLGQALREYAGVDNKTQLLSLLLPIQRAAEHCEWLARMVERGEIFHPLRWRPDEAFRLLQDAPLLERAGVILRMPAGWAGQRPPRPKVSAIVGTKSPSTLGMNALLDFNMAVTLGDETLTEHEVEALLQSVNGLAWVRGQWVEVDSEKLKHMMDRFRSAQRLSERGEFGFAEAMRMLASADIKESNSDKAVDATWTGVTAGPWLRETLESLRSPHGIGRIEHGGALRADLRPYQDVGVRWLYFLHKLGLGACLADDMGLGKTLQILAFLLAKIRDEQISKPCLIVAPASLLANWESEMKRFAPSLRRLVYHTSFIQDALIRGSDKVLENIDVVMTSYGALLRSPWLTETSWDTVILDEAQAIKNPSAKQTLAVKKIQAKMRIALTGTPVENRLGDLWSIFDFINPGLLGSAKTFTGYAKRLAQSALNSGDAQQSPYKPLRDLVRPYILRRLKTDKSVITDLPDKTEVNAYCTLSKKQAVLYQQAVDELEEALRSTDGIKRRGVVLAFLTRFKQICNHPSQWLSNGPSDGLSDNVWAEHDSGKWLRLRELAQVVADKQEKMLVFSQFKTVIPPLQAFLGDIFGQEGLVLHGNTPVKERQGLVNRFQNDEAIPFFILSLKAGGSGLNLTAASHVVHFDRWWNPAVENQATDRAFRIGQKKNVLVHKFICKGTVEEKIDALIASKKNLTQQLFEGGNELNLTELADDDLLKLVALDLTSQLEP